MSNKTAIQKVYERYADIANETSMGSYEFAAIQNFIEDDLLPFLEKVKEDNCLENKRLSDNDERELTPIAWAIERIKANRMSMVDDNGYVVRYYEADYIEYLMKSLLPAEQKMIEDAHCKGQKHAGGWRWDIDSEESIDYFQTKYRQE